VREGLPPRRWYTPAQTTCNSARVPPSRQSTEERACNMQKPCRSSRRGGHGVTFCRILPSKRWITRSQALIACWSWDAITTACPSSAIRVNNSRTRVLDVESSSPVGSSATTSDGSVARARAMATRCCSPPDSCPGRCVVRVSRPTAESNSVARLRRARPDCPSSTSGKATFARAVSDGKR